MRVLVTGGNGFIGSRVVKKLHERGYQIRCTLRKSSNTDRINTIPYETALADIRNKDSLKKAIQDCDAVIHCASLSNWKDLDSPHLRSIILDGTNHLLELIKDSPKRMVYLSSAAALGASQTKDEIRSADSSFNLNARQYTYAALKAQAEENCIQAYHNHQSKVVVVHPTETYGPGDHDLVTASTLIDFSKGPICLTCKGGTSIVHVDDVAEGIVLALEKGKTGKKYLLGGENLTVSKIADIVQQINQTTYPKICAPNWLMHTFVNLFSVIKLPIFQPLIIKYRYATHYWFFDNSNTENELGIKFRSPRQTIEDTLNWLKKEGLIK